MPITPDSVATTITAFTSSGGYVVPFCGWVQKVNSTTLRIFDEGHFDEWFEIKIADVVEQINGSIRPHENFRSVIWVKSDANVIKGQKRPAEFFSDGASRPAAPGDAAKGYNPPGSNRP